MHNYAISVPFLSTIFTLPNEHNLIDSKILYDQAKQNKIVPLELNSLRNGEVVNPYYIYTEEQYLSDWFRDNNFPVTTNIDAYSSKT